MISKLTVAIPTHNRNEYLVKLLKTIPQKFDGKVIISDNGNYVTNSIKSEFSNFDFIGIKDKIGIFPNWNSLIKRVETEWFIIPSDDDLFCSSSFEDIDHILKAYPDGDIFIFGHDVIDENDQFLSSWKPGNLEIFESPYGFNLFSKGVDARFPSIIFRTALVKQLGLFDESFEYTAADSLLIQKCLLYGKGIFIPKILSNYRTWPNNLTSIYNASDDWMIKIRKWATILEDLLKNDFSQQIPINNMLNFKDEMIARNLLSGVINKRRKEGFISALKFVIHNKFPYHADFTTQMRIFKSIIFK